MIGRWILALAAAATLFAAASCSYLHPRTPPVLIDGEWDAALPHVRDWAAAAPGRTYQVQDLDAGTKRLYPPLDSLILADAYRRAGLDSPMLQRFPPAPRKACVLCRENYIFYLRGGRIAGVEYRAVESDGWGGYRQSDEALGEISDAPPPSS